MQIRLTQPQDYPLLQQWWKWHRFSAPPIDMLDNLRFGIMVYDGETQICAGFLFFTNAKAYGLLEYIVSNPEVKEKNTRKQALILLINTLIEMAQSKGVKTLYSSLKNQNLIQHYTQCGFLTGSTNTTEMIINL